MEILGYFLAAGVALVAFGLGSNKLRGRLSPPFELTPNCLLTRRPLLFVTGPRSVFYFQNYWNFFPVYMAEHGYEVFHLRLPWSQSLERQTRCLDFLKAQHTAGQAYHLIVDTSTYEEMRDLFRQSKLDSIQSLTVLTPLQADIKHELLPSEYLTTFIEMENAPIPRWVQMSLWLHFLTLKQSPHLRTSCAGALGFYHLSNSARLLEHVRHLAEQDLQRS